MYRRRYMYITKQYKLYRFAYELVRDEGYEMIHLNADNSEIWLEKYERKTSTVIRLIHKDFDWKNELKADIISVFQRVKALQKLLVGKNIDIYNIYVSSYEPVDSWEQLLKPMTLKERKPVIMKVFYFASENSEDEYERLTKETSLRFINNDDLPTVEEREQRVNLYKINLSRYLHLKNKEKQNMFSFGKPLFTYILIALNVLMFMMLESTGSSLDVQNLINNGAKYNPAILDGEWWRIVSSMFLHIGVFHLFMNMLALYFLGTTVERIYGSKRFLFIYFLAGIGGGIVSFAFSVNVSAGASGALFGLFGALLFFGLIHKKLFLQTMGRGLLFIVGLNIVFGFLIPQIDMGAHLGGLVFGFIASAIVHLPKNRNNKLQSVALLGYLTCILMIGAYGVNANTDNPHLTLVIIEEHNMKEQYEDVVDLATKGLENPGQYEAELLFQRAYAYIKLLDSNLAINDLEKSVQINPNIAEAHYNLAILYVEKNDIKKAKESIQRAKKLKSNDNIDELYERLMQEDKN